MTRFTSQSARVAAVLSLVLSGAGCKRPDARRDAAQAEPFRLVADGCEDADAGRPGGSLTIEIDGPFRRSCTYALDDEGAAHVPVRVEPATGQAFVAGAPLPTPLEIPLLPLIADAPWAALRPVWSGEEAAKKVRERASERSVKTIEVRGAGRTDTFTIRVVGFELDDRAWQSLVRVAAKSPPKPAPSSGIAIFDVAASGQVFGAGRKDATLADFDWLATEEALGDQHVVKVCEYSGGTTRAIASESTKVTVTKRDGTQVASKILRASEKVSCPTSVFTVNGHRPASEVVVHPDATPWLTELASKAK